jgi:YgiT-type zinc finger domain-containing protein
MIMKCVICKTGDTYPGKTSYSIVKDNRVIIIRNVDAEICDNCEEAYFTSETSRMLSQKVKEALTNSSEEAIIRL